MSAPPPDDPSGAELERIASLARAAGRLGIDTEFMGEGRYRPLLCLVQVAVDDPAAPDAVRIVLLDPLRDEEPGPLVALLADPAVEVVLHAGRQDIALLRRCWSTEITNVFDTQLSAGFAGHSAQAGYASLLASLLGIHLPKTASYTRWDARPLSEEQRSYARADVAHLLALSDVLHAELEHSGRLEWAREECRSLEQSSDERDPELAYQRLPRIGQLRPRVRAVAAQLAAWRERVASAEDRPVSAVLSDVALLEIARRQPASTEALGELRGVQISTIRRRGEAILAVVAEGRAAPAIPSEEPDRAPSDARDAPVIALAEAVVRARAREAGLAYELIASRRDLAAIVAAVRGGAPEPPVRTLLGWRRDLVGGELLELLAGRRTVAVAHDGRIEIVPASPARGQAGDER